MLLIVISYDVIKEIFWKWCEISYLGFIVIVDNEIFNEFYWVFFFVKMNVFFFYRIYYKFIVIRFVIFYWDVF